MHRESIRTLRDRVQLFESFTLTEVGVLLQGAVRLTLSDGEMIAEQGSEGTCMFIMISGSAVVTREVGGDEELLATLAPGATLGELGLLDGRPRSARVRAKGETVILRLDRTDVDQCPLGISRKLYRNLALSLARRLRETNELVCASRSNATLATEPQLGRLVSVKAPEPGGDVSMSDSSPEESEQEGLERERLLAYWRTLRGETGSSRRKSEEKAEEPVARKSTGRGRSYADLQDGGGGGGVGRSGRSYADLDDTIAMGRSTDKRGQKKRR